MFCDAMALARFLLLFDRQALSSVIAE